MADGRNAHDDDDSVPEVPGHGIGADLKGAVIQQVLQEV